MPLTIAIAILCVAVVIGYLVVRSLRDRMNEGRLMPSENLMNFREMKQQGDISDQEYRTIKTLLGDQLRKESKDNGNAG